MNTRSDVPHVPDDPVSPSAAAGDGDSRPAFIDCHVQFWDPRRLTYSWLDEVPVLYRPFEPDDLVAAGSAPTGAIFVEAGAIAQDTGAEIEWIRREARRHPWILGAVAGARLEDPTQVAAALRSYTDDPFIVGVRRNLRDEPSGFTADPAFRAATRALGEVALPFDACVRDYQLSELRELAAACPRTTIVLDHLGKPHSAHSSWRGDLRRLATLDNVVCKLSGLMTEVAAEDTSRPNVVGLLREALETFGPDRCVYGSDWPVMTLATQYEDWFALVLTALDRYTAADADAVLRRNAARIYRLYRAAPSPGLDAAEPAA